MSKKEYYGIYTVGDENYFPGIVAAVNSLFFHGYAGRVAVIDIGFEAWMRDYLEAYERVTVLSIEPVKKDVRFTDVQSEESPVMQGWAYKAFSILHYDLFENWTFLDADYFPLCNVETELLPMIERGCFVSTEDGQNTWDHRHYEAIGVPPGNYMNINAGFISMSGKQYGHILHEWRNLMTRRKPFDLWYGDQGALNAILDKHRVEKTCVEKEIWNQTWLNEIMAKNNSCSLIYTDGVPEVVYLPMDKKIKGWHGTGWHKLWNQVGIDHYRKNNPEDRLKFFGESQGKSPQPIVETFRHFLFMDQFNQKLGQNDFLLTQPLVYEKSVY